MGSPASSRYGLGSDCVSRGPPPRFCGRGPRPRRVGRRRSFMHQCVSWSDWNRACGAHQCGAHYAAATSLARCTCPVHGRCCALSTFVWSSVYWRVRIGITVGALERDTRPRDATLPATSATRPSLRQGIAHAVAFNAKRPDRTRCRMDPAMRCGRQGSALDHLDYHLLAAIAQPLRRSAIWTLAAAGLSIIPRQISEPGAPPRLRPGSAQFQ